MLVDTHCHVNFKEYNPDRRDVVRRSLDSGVKMINVGISVKDSREVVALAREYDSGVWASVGIHPSEILSVHNEFSELKELAKEDKVVAIGECGLDFFRLLKNREAHMYQQEMSFRKHIELALSLSLPLIVHSREAYGETLKILREEGVTKGVVHCFTGSIEDAMSFMDLGLYVSFTGIISFPNTRDLEEVVRQVPLGRMMIETDAPFLAPQAYRGERNEPAYVIEVAKRVAEIKGMSFEEVAMMTTQNARDLFGI